MNAHFIQRKYVKLTKTKFSVTEKLTFTKHVDNGVASDELPKKKKKFCCYFTPKC